MKLIMENWRKHLREENITNVAPRHRHTANKIVDKVKNNFKRHLTSGRRQKRLVNLVHKSAKGKINFQEAEFTYNKKILPILLKAIEGVNVVFDPTGVLTPGAHATYTSAIDTIVMSNEYFWVSSSKFKDEKNRWEMFEETFVHELNHHLDAIWGTPQVKYIGKPEMIEKFTLGFAHPTHYSTKPTSLSAQQTEGMQKAYELLLKMIKTGSSSDPKARRLDNRAAYYGRPVEVYAELQTLLYKLGEIRHEDLELICLMKSLPASAVQQLTQARKKLKSSGWTDNMIDGNMFIKYLDCSTIKGNSEITRKLNQVAKADKINLKKSMTAEE